MCVCTQVSEYVNDIYEYMRKIETDMPIGVRYLDGTELNGRMRGILVDWLVQVHLRFHLLQETLYLTVAIIDRFLQVRAINSADSSGDLPCYKEDSSISTIYNPFDI